MSSQSQSKKDDHLLDQINNMLYQCDSFRKITPPENKQARLIISNFYEQLLTLKNSIEVDQYESGASSHNPLTKRENEILEHVANGFTNKEIASALSISSKTIEFHLRSIFQKTESSSRTEAVKNAIKNDWIKP